jgi:hypothetical protein
MNPKTIVADEIKKFLNEGYIINDDNFIFNERLNNSRFTDYDTFTNDYDTQIIKSDIIVTWKISFWANEMGIENFIVEVKGVKGNYKIEMRNKQSDAVEQTVDKDINEIDWNFIIQNATLNKGGSLYITNLDFDFKNHTCAVNLQ